MNLSNRAQTQKFRKSYGTYKKALIVLIPVLAFAINAQAADGPPNILFCFADDWGYYASCFADPEVPGVNDCLHTPAMDRLAEEGVSFNHAYVNVPSCMPSRAAVATGCYFWRAGSSAMMGARGNWEGLDDPRQKLPGLPLSSGTRQPSMAKQRLTFAGILPVICPRPTSGRCWNRWGSSIADGHASGYLALAFPI